VPPELLAQFQPDQLVTLEQIIALSQPKPSPKLVDLRLDINLIWQRFYLVLLIGKDRRQRQRHYVPTGIAKIGNAIVALILLLGVNLCVECR
jgi:hypothetical protein